MPRELIMSSAIRIRAGKAVADTGKIASGRQLADTRMWASPSIPRPAPYPG
ncbi:hypothetical protein DPMN_152430 [Dreissena polymorpha]|uniref:Uncharacterized protein n=1 Tax=Dreissena polymorpha TaxID=45954 RepID=A0A9D4FN02_DREPO|nr:hypothetical protein DPMN_152430 [Dreissena polymorpha]